jgi:V8-like Glu-specific endopeptidase
MFFGGWAQEITVIPGRNGSEEPFGRVVSTDFSSLTQWVEGEDSDYDIGCIHLSESIGSTTGWLSAGALPADRLLGLSVNVSGYPSDRGAGTEQYHDSSRIVAVTGQRLYYELDTYGGQSGAPAWVQERPDAPVHVIGVHAYGPSAGAPPGVTQPVNSAPRLTGEVLGKIREWVTADGGWPDRGTNLGGVPSQAGDLLSAGDLSAIQDLLREALSGGRATPARSAL